MFGKTSFPEFNTVQLYCHVKILIKPKEYVTVPSALDLIFIQIIMILSDLSISLSIIHTHTHTHKYVCIHMSAHTVVRSNTSAVQIYCRV